MSFSTFFHKVEAIAKRLFGSTTWEKSAISVITYAGPVVESIITMADPPAQPLVHGIIETVKSDLTTVVAVLDGAKAVPGSTTSQTVQAALTSVHDNLTGLLQVAEVKNSAKISQITATVNLVNDEMAALLTNLPK